jgi:hypothetical protein
MKATLWRLAACGTNTSITSGPSGRSRYTRRGALPVTRLCGPAYSSAAISRCSGDGFPVTVRYTPGRSRCHLPLGLHQEVTVLRGSPQERA